MPHRVLLLAAAVAALPPVARAEPPLAVEIVTATAESRTLTHSLTGELRARDTLSAAFPAGGRLTEVTIDAGATVAKGAVLARIDSVQQEQELRAAQAGLLTASADRRQAAEDLDRQDALLERGATTRIARDGAEDALRIAEGALAEAEATLDRAEKALADAMLVAPEDATVTRRLAEPGQIVGAAQPVVELALGMGFDAVFDVPEVLLTGEDTAPPVMLNLLDRPEVSFAGRVDEISPVIDSATGTVTVTVSVIDPPPGLGYGEPVRGTVEFHAPPEIALPYTAISATAEGPAVWIVDPATMAVAPVGVVIDRYETGRFIVSSGIADGMLVVGKGTQLLYPGRIVRAAGGGQ